MRRLKVDSPRNSACGSANLADLDWSTWWTDQIPGAGLYLHVAHQRSDSYHRVRCRHSESARLLMDRGALKWLVD